MKSKIYIIVIKNQYADLFPFLCFQILLSYDTAVFKFYIFIAHCVYKVLQGTLNYGKSIQIRDRWKE